MAKIGVNDKTEIPKKSCCSFIIVDNKSHLNERGIDYLCGWLNKLYLITINDNHIAKKIKNKYSNLEILSYDRLDLKVVLEDLYTKYAIINLTI